LISILCQFGLLALMARGLGNEEFGKLAVTTAILAVAASLCGLGAGDAVTRRIARNPEEYPRMLGHGLILIAASGLVLTLLTVPILAAIVTVSPSLLITVGVMTAFAVSGIMLVAFIRFAERVFIGRQEFSKANLISASFSIVRLVTGLVAFLIFTIEDLSSWCLWSLIAHMLTCALCARLLQPLGRPALHLDIRELRLGFHFCTPFIVDALRQNADRAVLSFVVPIGTLGTYAAAIKIVEGSQFVVSSLNRVAYPLFVKNPDLGFGSVPKAGLVYAAAVSVMSSATAFGLFICAPYLPLLLGPDYEPTVQNLQLLCWLLVPLALLTVPYDLLGAMEHHPVRARIYNSVSLLGIGGMVLAVYEFQMLGVFVSLYAIQVALALALWIVLFRVKAVNEKPRVPVTRSSG